MNLKVIFWAVVALTALSYGLMLVWSIPIITADADGLLIFDLRPLGYSFEEAQAFLAVLSSEGSEFYRTTQRALDTAFPLLEAISIGWAIFLLLPVGMGGKRLILALMALPGTIFDLLENASVAALLRAGADGITSQMVAQASFYTQMKYAFVTASMLVLMVVLIAWFVRRPRS